jgi:hypothetical protein
MLGNGGKWRHPHLGLTGLSLIFLLCFFKELVIGDGRYFVLHIQACPGQSPGKDREGMTAKWH